MEIATIVVLISQPVGRAGRPTMKPDILSRVVGIFMLKSSGAAT